MLDLISELQRTSTARWEEDAFEGHHATGALPGGGKPRPRLLYCKAILSCLAELEPDADFATVQITRADMNGKTGHQGNATLYSTFGRQARRSLVRRLGDGGLGGVLGGRDVVGYAVAETKIWSHRPHREGWLAALDDAGHVSRRFAAETLVRVLADWAARNPRLARIGAHLPPLTAVEDLCVVSGGHASPARAAGFLATTLRTASELHGASALAVLNVVHSELMEVLAIGDADHVDELTRGVKAQLSEIEYLWQRLDACGRERLASRLQPMLGDLNRRMEKDE
ncbi:hypothetical protein [Actinomadura rubrisoli]|uniref:Uncharacterized protein n=1 Tax=Actinomadura rubrisoli TaxID=2530368 RepID=A0A4R5BD19_9ACTN|nr:hypothetical protein [Actinomadura rubrisoli]TDD82636.1 hypothetical protein E1298_22480 [Actinomadura rubrisoli]